MSPAERRRMARFWRSVERLWFSAGITERMRPTKGRCYTADDCFTFAWLAGERARLLDSFEGDR